MKRCLPYWLRHYRREDLGGDLVAGLVVAMLLVPQGLAYAALAGLPPQLGLYASLAPLLIYPLFGASPVMSVGPVALISVMTAAVVAPLAPAGSPEYVAAAVALAALAGVILTLGGFFRLGVLARMISYPVVSGFISGAAALIVVGQLRPLLGIEAEGQSAVLLVIGMIRNLESLNVVATLMGFFSLIFLWLSRAGLPALLMRLGLPHKVADLLSKLAPMVAVLFSAALVAVFDWQDRLAVAGELPTGLPMVALPKISLSMIQQLWWPALVVGVIGFLHSVAIAQAFAARKGHRIDPDAELRGLGAANIASALWGSFPVTGSFSRSAVNAEAGANSQLSGILAAFLIALVLLFATGLFRTLPMTVLAATIILPAWRLMDFKTLQATWRYDRAEGLALMVTALGVLLAGIDVGIALGVVLSFMTFAWRISRPHMAVLGRVPGSEHFRNVQRHAVETRDDLLMVRIDENLFFGNAESVEKRLLQLLGENPAVQHLVLVMSSVSHIDATALQMLRDLYRQLKQKNIGMHFAEVKGPVMDQLDHGDFSSRFEGQVFISAHQAFRSL